MPETKTKYRRRPNARPVPRRPKVLLQRLTHSERSTVDSESGKVRTEFQASQVDEPLSIPPTSSSSSEESERESCTPKSTDRDCHSLPCESKRISGPDKSVKGGGKSGANPLDESLIIPSSALAEKARKILERELMFEKLIAQSKADLEALEEQINELGTGYVAVSRCVTTRPQRKMVEIPEMVPSPVHARQRDYRKAAIDALDENFSRSFSSRPPLPPKNTRLSDSKPLLTNVPLTSNRKLV
jgi:hypothetical protein